MPANESDMSPATVWASTFVPSKAPLPGYGEDGYSVAWVDTPHGRLQVLVVGPCPAPGTAGRVVERTFGETKAALFEADPA